jgi:hypothetical protein
MEQRSGRRLFPDVDRRPMSHCAVMNANSTSAEYHNTEINGQNSTRLKFILSKFKNVEF